MTIVCPMPCLLFEDTLMTATFCVHFPAVTFIFGQHSPHYTPLRLFLIRFSSEVPLDNNRAHDLQPSIQVQAPAGSFHLPYSSLLLGMMELPFSLVHVIPISMTSANTKKRAPASIFSFFCLGSVLHIYQLASASRPALVSKIPKSEFSSLSHTLPLWKGGLVATSQVQW